MKAPRRCCQKNLQSAQKKRKEKKKKIPYTFLKGLIKICNSFSITNKGLFAPKIKHK